MRPDPGISRNSLPGLGGIRRAAPAGRHGRPSRAPLPLRFSGEQLASLRLQVDITRRARVFPSAADSYAKQVQQFFRFCAAAGIEPALDSYDALTAFFQWYVAGVGDRKLRAHTTLGSYLSAFADHCADRDLPFAFKDTPLRRRVNRFIKGLKNLFPHEPRRTVALCLDKLGLIAVDYGFRSVADLYRRSV